MASKGALATLNDDDVLDRIASGEIMRNIASELGVGKASLRERLMKHERYKSCISEQAQSFVEDSIEEHRELPADMPFIARARARADVAFKYAKAHNPAYADKQQIEHTASGPLFVIAVAPVAVANAPIDGQSAVCISSEKP